MLSRKYEVRRCENYKVLRRAGEKKEEERIGKKKLTRLSTFLFVTFFLLLFVIQFFLTKMILVMYV